jgi:isopenicillin N synthase-like dioxygenase
MDAGATTGLRIPTVNISSDNPQASTQLLDAAAKYGFVFIENDGSILSPEDIAQMFQLSQEFFAAPIEIKEEVSISSNKAGKNHGWLSRGIEKLDPATQKRADVKEYVYSIISECSRSIAYRTNARRGACSPFKFCLRCLCRRRALPIGYPPRLYINLASTPLTINSRALNIGEHQTNTLQQPLPKPLQPYAHIIIDFQNACHAFCRRIFEHFARALDIELDWFSNR